MSLSAPSIVSPVLEQICTACHPKRHAELIKSARSLAKDLNALFRAAVDEEKRQARLSDGSASARPSAADGRSDAPRTTSEEPHADASDHEAPHGAQKPHAGAAPGASDSRTRAAASVVHVLAMAADTRLPKACLPAVDCVQKLIQLGVIQGRVAKLCAPGAAGPAMTAVAKGKEPGGDASGVTPAAVALGVMCACADLGDEAVEVQVVRGLLSTITSTHLQPHGEALLDAIRALVAISIGSRSEQNQSTARAALVQSLTVVFRRMESGSAEVSLLPVVVKDRLAGVSSILTHGGSQEGAAPSGVGGFFSRMVSDVESAWSQQLRLPALVVTSLADAFKPADPGEDEPTSAHASGADEDAAAQRASNGGAGAASGGEGRASDAGPGLDRSASSVSASGLETVWKHDAYLLLRSLCALSTKATDVAGVVDPVAVRAKLLSLELLKIVLENSGPAFTSSHAFLQALRQHLCLALLKNGSSGIPEAIRLSCSIFLTLVLRYRHHLKAEVGIFFPMILLKVLETASGPAGVSSSQGAAGTLSFNHLAVVLRCLRVMCEDGRLLVDLFVNYDCDLDGPDVFARMVSGVAAVARGAHHEHHHHAADAAGAANGRAGAGKGAPRVAGESELTPQQEAHVRMESLQCLASVQEGLVHWYKVQAAAADAEADAARAAAVAASAAAAAAQEDDGSNEPSSHGEKSAGTLAARRNFKASYQEGIALFNSKPRKGLQRMQEAGMVGAPAVEVATFLLETPGLDKTAIGELLGEHEEECVEVMHAFVDLFDFAGMDFDGAIRALLETFRLPGEAQKIDRIMEKFAERYCNCNPGAFKTADVAYVLAFSVIMLNTDAHNKMVRHKMTRQAFINNNRGINDGQDLDEGFLNEIYDRITTNEIKMKDAPDAAMGAPGAAAAATAAAATGQNGLLDAIWALFPQRRQVALEPTDEEVQAMHAHLRAKARGATFLRIDEAGTVRPMMEAVWHPILGAFFLVFHRHGAAPLVDLCLSGVRASALAAAHLGMSAHKDALVRELVKATRLDHPEWMAARHAAAARTLLWVAEESGGALGQSWVDVLRCVSKLEALHLLATGAPPEAILFGSAPRAEHSSPPKTAMGRLLGRKTEGPAARKSTAAVRTPSMSTTAPEGSAPSGTSATATAHPESVLATAPSANGDSTPHGDAAPAGAPASSSKMVQNLVLDVRELPHTALQALRSVDPQAIQRLFVRSQVLGAEAIVDFVRALCVVSEEELSNPAALRVFSLSKIVELAHFNMGRIRLVWARIWAVLSDHFSAVGCHPSMPVAMYAVDSLRQLAMKFLERDELSNFTFQNDFLRPFVTVMRNSPSAEIRELVVRCTLQMVQSRVGNIKSGWKSMFMVFTAGAHDERSSVVRLGFTVMETIVRDHFAHITATEVTVFTDCVNCLIAYANNRYSTDVALNAIAFLRYCAIKLAEGSVLRPDAPGSPGATSPTARRSLSSRPSAEGAAPPKASPAKQDPLFDDSESHVHFWFPLLVGLSELAYDPRSVVRRSALEVVFDILNYHGGSFSGPFWTRVMDRVVLPLYDGGGVVPETGDPREEEGSSYDADQWLCDTCTLTFPHLAALASAFHDKVEPSLPRLVGVLTDLIGRPHEQLASVSLRLLTQLLVDVGPELPPGTRDEFVVRLCGAVRALRPDLAKLLPAEVDEQQPRTTVKQVEVDVEVEVEDSDVDEGGDAQGGAREGGEAAGGPPPAGPVAEQAGEGGAAEGGVSGEVLEKKKKTRVERVVMDQEEVVMETVRAWRNPLQTTDGLRELVRCRVAIAVLHLAVVVLGEMYAKTVDSLSLPALEAMLDCLRDVVLHATEADGDYLLRLRLARAQHAARVPSDAAIEDPPLLSLEREAACQYLSILLHIQVGAQAGNTPMRSRAAKLSRDELRECDAVGRMVALCVSGLEVFTSLPKRHSRAMESDEGMNDGLSAREALVSAQEELRQRAPIVLSVLNAVAALGAEEFKRNLKAFFPLMTEMIATEDAPADVREALSRVFLGTVGPLLGS
ncbi:unnamed protein product [Pedinophyceae sp. YPF-701]|nr:unnamed protein product [Pedinophyceae sp. YPF-701]